LSRKPLGAYRKKEGIDGSSVGENLRPFFLGGKGKDKNWNRKPPLKRKTKAVEGEERRRRLSPL